MKSSTRIPTLFALLFVALLALPACSADTLTGPEPTVEVQTAETNDDTSNTTDPPDGHNTHPDDL